MHKLLPDGELCGVKDLIGSHYEGISMIYRMLGAKVIFDPIRFYPLRHAEFCLKNILLSFRLDAEYTGLEVEFQ
jgi:hypothetical protein